MSSRLILTFSQVTKLLEEYKKVDSDMHGFDAWFKAHYGCLLFCQPLKNLWFIDFKTDEQAALFKLTHL